MEPVPVLFLEPTLGPGGAEHILFDLVTRLDRDRFTPVVCCLKEPGVIGDALIAAGVPVYRGILSSRFSLAPLGILVPLMRREGIRIVHTISQPLNTTWGVAAGRIAGVPVQVASVHGMRGLPRQGVRRTMNRVLGPAIDAVICLSESHRDYLVAEEGVDARKARVIHNGIDLERFRPATRLRRADLGLPENARLAGVVAGLRPEKAHDTFLRAAASVRERLPGARFVLIGDGPERERLTRLTDSLGLNGQVHFLGRRDDVADVLPLLDLSVLPSRSEAFPLAILESMAAGRPVVASGVGSIPDMVSPGETGLLVPADDAEALAGAMTRLLANPDEARRMGEAGRGRVQHYDTRRMVHEVEDLYEELLRGKGRSFTGVAPGRPLPRSLPGAGREAFNRRPVDLSESVSPIDASPLCEAPLPASKVPPGEGGQRVERGRERGCPGAVVPKATSVREGSGGEGAPAPGDSLRVLVLTNMYPRPDNPSLGIFVKQQVESLRARGVEVDVLFVDGPRSKANYLRGVFDVARQIRQRRYDLIHAHYVFSGFLARTQLRYPIVLTHHGPEVIMGWQKPLCKMITPWVDRVIAVSEQVKTVLGNPRIQVIPCGIDTDLFVPGDSRAARRALDLPIDRQLVLWAASKRPEKRLDRAQQAMTVLRSHLPDAELVIASSLPPERIPTYMNACDVLLLTSDAEGSPQVVKEAMACNLPVVSTDVGDVARVIGGTDGCFITGNDPADIAARLEAALRRGQRTDGRKTVEHLSLSSVADRVIQVYRDTVANATWALR